MIHSLLCGILGFFWWYTWVHTYLRTNW